MTIQNSGRAWSRPELLAPAGDWECAKAAVENGADAIYFGLERFNARMRAQNFTVADLPRLMEFLHRRGVRGYVTFNTLVFADELSDAEAYLKSVISAGVDAAIVQDIGVCRLIRRLSRDFPIHASTQMTITSAAGVGFARELGCQLVVLARECSLKEIGMIQEAQAALAALGGPEARDAVPLEVFVHGALCVAYSGQCLTSESLGGRSANRGECAQACRMPYELISDGKTVPLGDRKYLLSPQDLAGLDLLPELVRAGLASLKIEGRLKSAEYVASITSVYRQALDRAMADLAGGSPLPEDQRRREGAHTQSQYDIEMAFSRGLYTGWFRGINNQELAHARFGKKRGVYLGAVVRVEGSDSGVLVDLEGPLKPGDGVVFDAGHPETPEEGGRIYAVDTRGKFARLEFGRGDVDFSRIHPGDRLWKTSDPELDRRLRKSFAGDRPNFRRPIHVEVHGIAGRPMTLVARDDLGHALAVESSMPLVVAERHPLDEARLIQQLGRLGGTSFELGRLENRITGELLLPVSELNRMRREMVRGLENLRAKPTRWSLRDQAHGAASVAAGTPVGGAPSADTKRVCELAVLIRSLEQLEAALDAGATTLYCEFEDPKKYCGAVQLFRARHGAQPSRSEGRAKAPSIWVAPPRIFKTGEEWILKIVRSSEADGYLVRNFDHLGFFGDSRLRGDFSLNVANPLTAEYFKTRFGIERLTASYDLNNSQLEALLRSAPPEWFEITIHQHMPMFHMEHCVFCAFLSTGTDYTNCGRPCDRHEVKLRDRVGAEHRLKADAGCRNTVFNARAQTGAEHVARLLDLGARHFRIEFLDESPSEIRAVLTRYRELLRGEITGADLWREFRLTNQLGVTRGPINAG